MLGGSEFQAVPKVGSLCWEAFGPAGVSAKDQPQVTARAVGGTPGPVSVGRRFSQAVAGPRGDPGQRGPFSF